jgi:hypothetical protein
VSVHQVIARGILKYPHNWIRRTVSESSCDVIVENGSDFDLLFSSVEDIYSDDDIAGEHRMGAKKNVRFSDNVSKTIYRPNSSILGRKLKNQKRSKARKNSHRKDSLTENVSKILKTDKLETERSRQDSGYDSEDNGHSGGDVGRDGADVSNKTYNNCIEIETGIENLVFE